MFFRDARFTSVVDTETSPGPSRTALRRNTIEKSALESFFLSKSKPPSVSFEGSKSIFSQRISRSTNDPVVIYHRSTLN